MKKRIYILLLSLCSGNLFTQNFVPNYSFEEHSSCITGVSAIDAGFVDFWGGFESADYFNICSIDSSTSIPQNIVGYQLANTGVAYAGIRLYANLLNPISNEFIQVQLTDSLDKSHYYCISFYVSLGDSSNYAVQNFGAYFSEETITLSDIENNSYIPQVTNPADSMLNNKINWKKISGYYFANGGEQFLTIGNFYNNAYTINQHLGGAPSPFYDLAYYYIDDVSVVQCDSLFTSVNNNIALSKAIKPIRLYPNPNDGNMILDYVLLPCEKGEIIFYDLAGKQIVSYLLDSTDTQLKLNNIELQAGVYFYLIKINDKAIKREKITILKK